MSAQQQPQPGGVDYLLDCVRRRIPGIAAPEAWLELHDGALLIDLRQEVFRRGGEQIPGSLVLDRNVLEWRLDPLSAYRLPEATTHDRRIIVICADGYAGVLAAESLHRIGLHRATYVIDGFEGWKEHGMPLVPGFTETGSFVQEPDSWVTIDTRSQDALVWGRRVTLSRLELVVLGELLRGSGRTVSRDELNIATGQPADTSSRSVDLVVHRLRRRLGPGAAECLETVRGVGYRLHASVHGCEC